MEHSSVTPAGQSFHCAGVSCFVPVSRLASHGSESNDGQWCSISRDWQGCWLGTFYSSAGDLKVRSFSPSTLRNAVSLISPWQGQHPESGAAEKQSLTLKAPRFPTEDYARDPSNKIADSKLRYDRQLLYQEVWEKPLRSLASRYGVSDVGLAKACRRLLIPLPGQGYWAKLSAGRPVPSRPTLPSWPSAKPKRTTGVSSQPANGRTKGKGKGTRKIHRMELGDDSLNSRFIRK